MRLLYAHCISELYQDKREGCLAILIVFSIPYDINTSRKLSIQLYYPQCTDMTTGDPGKTGKRKWIGNVLETILISSKLSLFLVHCSEAQSSWPPGVPQGTQHGGSPSHDGAE